MLRDWKCPACGLVQTTDVEVGGRARRAAMVSLLGGVLLSGTVAISGYPWLAVLVGLVALEWAFLLWRVSQTNEVFVTCRCSAVVQLHRTDETLSKVVAYEPRPPG